MSQTLGEAMGGCTKVNGESLRWTCVRIHGRRRGPGPREQKLLEKEWRPLDGKQECQWNARGSVEQERKQPPVYPNADKHLHQDRGLRVLQNCLAVFSPFTSVTQEFREGILSLSRCCGVFG